MLIQNYYTFKILNTQLLKKTFTTLLLFVGCCILGRLVAQDIHFSQFYASPLTLNPALTGVIDGSYRVAGIYRNQYRSFTTPYVSYSASYDMKLLQKYTKNDVFGVGGVFVGDKSGDGALNMYSGMISLSYHKSLGKKHNHFLGLGIQAGYTQKSVNWATLTYPDQHIGVSDFTLPTGESGLKSTVSYFDLQAGFLHQSWVKEEIGIFTGLSIYHLTNPQESFSSSEMRLQNRITAHAGAYIKVVKHFYLTPNLIYQYQNKAQEFNIGTGFEYHMDTKKSPLILFIGLWDRISATDAFIVSAGIEYYKVRLSFAYDITTSSLTAATQSRSAFELALIYTGLFKSSGFNYPRLVPCPRM